MSKSTQAPTFQAGVIFSLVVQGAMVCTITLLALRAAMLSVPHGAVTVSGVSSSGDSRMASGQTPPVSFASADPRSESVTTPMGHAVEVAPQVPIRALTIEERTPEAEPARLSQKARHDLSPPLPMEATLTGQAVSQPTASTGGRGAGPSLEEFLREVRNQLEASKRYPELARHLGQEGAARLRFTITLSGETENIRLAQSSGWKALDQETVEFVKRVGRFPAPPMMWKEGVTIQVPVVFELTRP